MIYLIEPCKDKSGHYFVYLNSLLKIPNTKALQMDVRTTVFKKRMKFLNVLTYYYALWKQLRAVPKGNIAHLLYSDIYYKIPFISSSLLKRNKTIVTMHSCPNGKIKHLLMRNFCKRVDAVVVHSEYIKSQMELIGLTNVHCIDYPSFYDYSFLPSKEELRQKYGLLAEDVVFSALGGIRKDKGLDILLEAFKYVDMRHKRRMILNVAGRYCSFMKEADIKRLAEKYNIRTRLLIRSLSDEEFLENVLITDFMVLPYRGNMTGNSGPMTEAIVNGIPSIVPADTNLGAIVTERHVGMTFRQGDPESLASVLIKACDMDYICNDAYRHVLKEQSFIDKYRNIYTDLNRG